MKPILAVLPGIFLLTGTVALGAENTEGRLCNLQGREIALRISEEVESNLVADQRGRIALIAEEVCLAYNISATASENTAEGLSARPVESATEGDTGLLGDIRVIEPEDRVRRAGLKRR